MDTCVGCRIYFYFVLAIVRAFYYLFIVYWPSVCDLAPIRGCVICNILNIYRPDGATYSQTVYVPKYSPRAVSASVGS